MSLKKNTIWNLIGSGSPLLAAAVCIPYTLKALGAEGFGVLTLIWALIGYFNFFDFGAGRALTYEISRLQTAMFDAISEQRRQAIHQILKAGLILTAVTGILGFLLIMGFAYPLAHDWLKITPTWQHDAKLALQITAVGVIPATLTSGMRGALEGLGQFKESNINKIFLGFCMFILPALSIFIHGSSLWRITIYLVLARLVTVLYGCIQLKHYLFIPEKLHPIDAATHNFSKVKLQIRQLVSYGFWVTITGIVSPLMVYGDRFFVSALVGADKLSEYAIPQEGLMRLLMIPIAICGALMPVFATIAKKTDLQLSYATNLRRMAKIMAGLCLLTLILAYPGFAWWISPEFAEKAFPITAILIFGTFINGVAVVPYTLLHATGNTKTTALFHIFELFFYMGLLVLLTRHFGLIGAAFAWVCRVTVDWVLLHFAAQRLLNITLQDRECSPT
ncbi:flippase [Undibacterium fentianense]|uniref:Flippase n=1 Tax=Undibacterium fentianense TaxID=2828728 RepID=A0A941E0Y5_9BURK|nr:flippase [Undibacterium fentianense]MBR7799032.1 flippase [Undibacterium fentianense]